MCFLKQKLKGKAGRKTLSDVEQLVFISFSILNLILIVLQVLKVLIVLLMVSP